MQPFACPCVRTYQMSPMAEVRTSWSANRVPAPSIDPKFAILFPWTVRTTNLALPREASLPIEYRLAILYSFHATFDFTLHSIWSTFVASYTSKYLHAGDGVETANLQRSLNLKNHPTSVPLKGPADLPNQLEKWLKLGKIDTRGESST